MAVHLGICDPQDEAGLSTDTKKKAKGDKMDKTYREDGEDEEEGRRADDT